MKKFEIILENKKKKIYATISTLIIALNFFLFMYMGITRSGMEMLYSFAGAAFLAFGFIFQRVNKKQTGKFDLLYGIVIITWIFMQSYWPAIANLALYSLYSITARPFMVVVAQTGITYPSFPKKTYAWNDFNNVILKDGLLTIDFKDNKLIQQVIERNAAPVDEKEFNEFCSGVLQND
jgi:hypothetical protein